MTSLSVKQKALIFLYKYRTYDKSDIYNTPWELTQDGVAGAVGVSRAHASIVLNQLKEEGNVEERITHIRNGKTKRKSYFITPSGMEEGEMIIDLANKEKIDIAYLLETRKKGYDISFDNLNKGDRFALGCACAFNMPVDKSILPPMTSLILPTDMDGKISISEELRKDFLEYVDDEERASFHGYAANYWFDKKLKKEDDFYECIHELLYQYVECGRNRDACKLISGEVYYFINSIDDQLHDTVKKVRPIEKYERGCLMLSIDICLEYGEMDEADASIKRLSEIDSNCASTYRFDYEMMQGNKEAAKAAIAGIWQSYPTAGLRWASLLREEGKYEEARETIGSIRGAMYDADLANFQIEKFVELARIDSAEGRYEDAYQRLSKARASANNAVFNKKLNALEKELKARLKV